MSVEFTEEESRKAVDFLRQFVADHAEIGEHDALPFRIVPFGVGQEELQGESTEWILEYLRRSKCAEDVAVTVAHQAVTEMLETDLTLYKLEEDNQLDASLVARFVFNRVQDICHRWSQEPPKFHRSKMSYESCVHAIKNSRRKMEDKHVIMAHFNALFGLPKNSPNYAYFAVYDGHGGIDAVTFTATHLHSFLAREKNLFTDPGLAIHDTFLKTDQCFGIKALAEGLKSGCTVVSVLIVNDTMYIAWLGDSQVILCKGGELVILMEPHKPERTDERKRIECLGGCVVWFGAWRVNGSLSVSRAIGDLQHKPYVSGEPDVAEYTFEGDEEFLILACDGLWDVVGREQAIELVRDHISQGNDRSTAAKLLVEQAKEGGSSDNISVAIVYLDTHRKEMSPSQVSDTVQDSIALSQNGIPSFEGSSINMDLNDKDEQVVKNENTEVDNIAHVNSVATVKISTETSQQKRTENVTCKVTCKDGKITNGKNSSKVSLGASQELYKANSASNNPKQSSRRRMEPQKSLSRGGCSLKSEDGKPKGNSPKQLRVSDSKSMRRRSAPDVLSLT